MRRPIGQLPQDWLPVSTVAGAHALVAHALQLLHSPQLQLVLQLRVLICVPSPHGPQACGRDAVSPPAHSPAPLHPPHSPQPFQLQLALHVRER